MTRLAPTGPQTFAGNRTPEPRVELILNGQRVLLAERYQVRLSVLTQPAEFSLTLGTPDALPELIRDLEPNTTFQLQIGGRLVMTGSLDGHASSGNTGVLTVNGRDSLAPLHDAYMLQEETFKDDTYAAIVRKVMDAVGLPETELVYSNRANRKAVMGVDTEAYQRESVVKEARAKGINIPPTAPPRAIESLKIAQGEGGGIKKHVQSQLGERAYEFLKRHLDRAGLFLWAAADGTFILSEPNKLQVPVTLIQRSYGATPEFSTVLDHNFENRTSGRFSEVHVYTRGETKKAGRSKSVVVMPDSEMQSYGFNRPLALRDANADTPAKAEYMARRKIAESRRAGWRLSYTVSGHTTGSMVGKSVVWAPDSVVEVDDMRLGIQGTFWIESVTFMGSPQATTKLDLMRLDDLVFGDAPT